MHTTLTIHVSAFQTTTASSLKTAKSTLTHAQLSNDSSRRFEDVVERIHKTLIIAPVVSAPSPSVRVRSVFSTSSQTPRAVTGRRKVCQLINHTFASMQTQVLETSHSGATMNVGVDQNNSTVSETSDPTPPGPEGQIEIPFVPAHKRQTLSSSQDHQFKDDTIIVVGQAVARQRKRKRDKARGISSVSQSTSELRLGGPEASTSTVNYDREVEEFDYSSVPNLLDDEGMHGHARGVHEGDERRRKKQRHGKGMLMTSDRYTVRFLRGIGFAFTFAQDGVRYPGILSGSSTKSWEFFLSFYTPRLRVTEIYSRIWTLRLRQLPGTAARPTRSKEW